MKSILDEIRERLELVTLGELPYRETDDEKITLYREQEDILRSIEAAARTLIRTLTVTRIGLAVEVKKNDEKKELNLDLMTEEQRWKLYCLAERTKNYYSFQGTDIQKHATKLILSIDETCTEEK